MKVYMVTGSTPPAMCGVGDYTVTLVNALRAEGVDAEIATSDSWSIAGGLALARSLVKREPGIVHMQYPTIGYGHRLGPQVLALFKKSIITLHEFSNVHVMRRAAELPLAVFAKHVVFTDVHERDDVARFWPAVSVKSGVIPIGSSINSALATPRHANLEVLYFGAIYPNKGLEMVVEFSRILKERELPLRVRIAGLLRPDYQSYADKLIAATNGLPVTWSLNQPAEKIVEYISSAFIAYLPYPDGSSERRSALKALLLGSLPCITTRGDHTMDDLGDAVLFAATPATACDMATQLLGSAEKWQDLSVRARMYARRYTWDGIAQMHRRLYESLSAREWLGL